MTMIMSMSGPFMFLGLKFKAVKTLIVYYSFTGNNEALAFQLQDRLACDILRIEEKKKRRGISILFDLIFKRRPRLEKYSIDWPAYQNFIFVAPIWAGKIGTPMLTFLQQERNNIRDYSFITLCGGAAGQKDKIQDFLASTQKFRPLAVEELWVNDLLKPEQREQIKYTTGYRVKVEDWVVFDQKIRNFLKALSPLLAERSKEAEKVDA